MNEHEQPTDYIHILLVNKLPEAVCRFFHTLGIFFFPKKFKKMFYKNLKLRIGRLISQPI